MMQQMYAHAQYCWTGDNTVGAIRHTVETITKVWTGRGKGAFQTWRGRVPRMVVPLGPPCHAQQMYGLYLRCSCGDADAVIWGGVWELNLLKLNLWIHLMFELYLCKIKIFQFKSIEFIVLFSKGLEIAGWFEVHILFGARHNPPHPARPPTLLRGWGGKPPNQWPGPAPVRPMSLPPLPPDEP